MSLLLQSLLTQPGGLHIVAEGSVLSQCWDMLKEGRATSSLCELIVKHHFGELLHVLVMTSELNLPPSLPPSFLHSLPPSLLLHSLPPSLLLPSLLPSSLPWAGFLEALEDEKLEFTIVILRVSSAVGAAALGAKEGGASLSQDFSSYTTTLFHYKPA